MKLTVAGCGDAFGSGGRLQTCYHVDTGERRFLIDCGATALIGLTRCRLDPNAVDAIFISHLHGDHFGGLVWWMLHAQHVSKRESPLQVIGPVGIDARFTAACEVLFPGSSTLRRRFELSFLELSPEQRLDVGSITVTPFEVEHPSGAPSYALRFETGGRTLAFSGDTQWVEAVVRAGHRADLLILECYAFAGAARFHMDWGTIAANLPRIDARRTMLTHMSEAMLRHASEIAVPGVFLAEDGLVVDL